MRLFKNYYTKKKLKKENERLKFLLHKPVPLHFVEHEVQKVCSCMKITDIPNNVPIEAIKREIAHNLAKELEPFIEWDIEDSTSKYRCGKIVKGSVYLVNRNLLRDEETDGYTAKQPWPERKWDDFRRKEKEDF